jgi:hypothetical protein
MSRRQLIPVDKLGPPRTDLGRRAAPSWRGDTGMRASDIVDAPRQVVCVCPVAAATEEVLKAWIGALEANEAMRLFIRRANCGATLQKQLMRIVVSFALTGRSLTQDDADRINGLMGCAFIPTTLPALVAALREVLREDPRIGPASVAVIETASDLEARP